MNKAEYLLKKHSPTILTVVGVSGVVITSILSVKATPKVLMLIEKAKEDKGDNLTITETIKAAWKPYVPAVISGLSTIACIVSINYISSKRQADLMSAYIILDNTFKEYRNKVNDVYGEDADTKVRNELVNSKYDGQLLLKEGEELFFDYNSMQFFISTMDKVLQAESKFLKMLENNIYVCMNDYYEMLGISQIPSGDVRGWYLFEYNDPYDCAELEFSYDKNILPDGTPCWVITTNNEPQVDELIYSEPLRK